MKRLKTGSAFSISPNRAANTLLVSAAIGSVVGSAIAVKKNKEFVEKKVLQEKGKKKVDAKDFFQKIKKSLPKDTVLLTNEELHAKVKKSKTIDELEFLQLLRSASEGNAAAIPKHVTESGVTKHLVPERFRGKNYIITDDKVNPAILAHEAGHIIDFDQVEKSPFLKKFFTKLFRGTVAIEAAAWDKAPKVDGMKEKDFKEMRDGALATYKRGRDYPIFGALGGAAVPLAIGGILAGTGNLKLASELGGIMKNFWIGFEKQGVSKEELKEVLKKHEERETPEQEAAESKKEQEIEREAGVEKHAAKRYMPQDVTSKMEPTVVIAWNPNLETSKLMIQRFDKALVSNAAAYDRARILAMDALMDKQTIAKLGLSSPSVSLWRRGKLVDSFEGMGTEIDYIRFLQSNKGKMA